MKEFIDRKRKYEIEKQLRDNIISARDTTNNTRSIWKSLPNTIFNERDIELVKSIIHPNVLPIIETFKDNERIYLVYGYKESLIEYIQRNGILKEEEAKRLMKQVIDGYKQFYDKGISHNDITPENIFLDSKQPKGKELMIGGFEFERKYVKDKATDIFGIGLVMYYMLHGENLLEKFKKIEYDKKERYNYYIRSDLSNDCIDLLSRCIQDICEMSITFDDILSSPLFSDDALAQDQSLVFKRYLVEENNEGKQPCYRLSMLYRNCISVPKNDSKKLKNLLCKKDKYPCTCEEKKDVELKCGHSLCINCIARMKRKIILKKIKEESLLCSECRKKLITEPENIKGVEICRMIPSVIHLSCGCNVDMFGNIKDCFSDDNWPTAKRLGKIIRDCRIYFTLL